ncbi:MAG: hypothetical protein BroJett018_14980 [Chloroflexota bacterium]|nr:hypothetical protein [Chloroflexota bacterium]GIK63704.1 MAG: hypothetical protein BroJett018_14980 [Chloroflexota bacterium]
MNSCQTLTSFFNLLNHYSRLWQGLSLNPKGSIGQNLNPLASKNLDMVDADTLGKIGRVKNLHNSIFKALFQSSNKTWLHGDEMKGKFLQ